MFQSLLVLLSATVVWSLKFPCDDSSCPAQTMTCVNRGDFCYTQSSYYNPGNQNDRTAYEYDDLGNEATNSWNPYDPCGYGYTYGLLSNNILRVKCPVCSEENTICHQGRCLELTQDEDQSCCTDPTVCDDLLKHKYCKAGLFCSTEDITGTLAGEGICAPIKLAREIGENCAINPQTNQDNCGRGTCDSVTQKCTFSVSDSAANPGFECDGNTDCVFGEYCKALYDVGTGVTLNKTCATSDMSRGSSCDLDQVGDMDTAGQCGHTLVCSRTTESAAECIEPFSKSEGSYCSSVWECKSGTFCNGDFCEQLTNKNKDANNDCCPRGYDENCPHVSQGTVTRADCQPDGTRQTGYEMSKKWSSTEKKFRQNLQAQSCQVADPSYACSAGQIQTEKSKPPASQAKCSTTYQGFRIYDSFATANSQVSRIVVVISILLTTFLS